MPRQANQPSSGSGPIASDLPRDRGSGWRPEAPTLRHTAPSGRTGRAQKGRGRAPAAPAQQPWSLLRAWAIPFTDGGGVEVRPRGRGGVGGR